MIAVTARKWRALLSAYVQDNLAYRASGFIWLLTDIVPALVMPLVWVNAFNGRSQIAGFDPSQIVTYYLISVTLANFVISHLMWDIAVEIKEGQFSVALARPFSYFQNQFVRNISWRLFRTTLFIPVGALLCLYYRDYVDFHSLYLGWELWAAILLGHVLSFLVVFAMSLLALWVQEVFSLFELYYIPMLFLSGQLVPLATLPGWANALATVLPFRYTVALPAELAVGRITPEAALPQIGIQVLWIIGAWIGGRLMWKHGLKQYTGVGM